MHHETGGLSAETAVALGVVVLSIVAIIVAIADPLATGAVALKGLLPVLPQ
jgi:phage-related minor tail protein